MYQPVVWEGNKATYFNHIFINHLQGKVTNTEINTTKFVLTSCLEHSQMFKQNTNEIATSCLGREHGCRLE